MLTEREQWLTAIMLDIRAHFQAAGFTVLPNIRVSCGFPSVSALSPKKRRIGECWDSSASTDKQVQIFISPTIDDPARVVDILIHEVVHAVVGLKAKHNKPFASCAAMVGLVKPWTATTATLALTKTIESWLVRVGPYPHGALSPMLKEKQQKGRMLLMECICGLKIRTTKQWLDLYGPEWPCPCGGKLVADAETDDN